IEGASQLHISVVFVLGGLVFFLNAYNSVYTSIPVALQRFDIVSKYNLSQLAFFNLSTLVLVLLGLQLKAVMVVNVLSLVFLTLAYRFKAKQLLPNLQLRFTLAKAELKRLYSFGLMAAFSNLSNSSLNN